jgi:chemotaxis protein MotB
MKKKKKQECPPLPGWMTTFSDLMALLLTFFVLLFSMSSISREKFIKFLETISMMWGIELKPAKLPPAVPTSPIVPEKLYPKVDQWSDVMIASAKAKELFQKKKIPVEEVKKTKELILRIPADFLYEEGSYVPRKEYIPLLKKVCEILKKLNLPIRIEGHTDNKPIYRYPLIVDNWDLSLLRAIYIEKLFVKWGFPENKISAAGYADTMPIAPNNSTEGRAKNRRVDFVIILH